MRLLSPPSTAHRLGPASAESHWLPKIGLSSYPGGDTPTAKAFANGCKAKTGKDADQWAALGYSLMTVVASAVKSAGPNPTRDGIREALTKSKEIPVVVGTGKYSYVNRIPTYGTSFLMVKDGKFVAAP